MITFLNMLCLLAWVTCAALLITEGTLPFWTQMGAVATCMLYFLTRLVGEWGK